MKHRLLEHLNEYFFGHLKPCEEEIDHDLMQYLINAANELKALTEPKSKKAKKKKGK